VTEKGFISFAAREGRETETAGRRETDETARPQRVSRADSRTDEKALRAAAFAGCILRVGP
jgi:hypothetical protein